MAATLEMASALFREGSVDGQHQSESSPALCVGRCNASPRVRRSNRGMQDTYRLNALTEYSPEEAYPTSADPVHRDCSTVCARQEGRGRIDESHRLDSSGQADSLCWTQLFSDRRFKSQSYGSPVGAHSDSVGLK